MNTINRNYKDSLFRLIFNESSDLLELYNAVNNTNYTDPEKLEYVTLENAIYMNIKNDLAFIIGCRLNMYEHQSSLNPNLPLRFLHYVSREYEKLTINMSIYSTTRITLPTPSFIVFYNGTEECEDKILLKLSDAFDNQNAKPQLELMVTQLNINNGRNKSLRDKCRKLDEYMQYVEKIRELAVSYSVEDSVELAVEYCIRNNILKDILEKNRAEAVSMSIFEYDEEKEMALLREAEARAGRERGLREGLQEGRQKGLQEGRQEGLQEGRQEGLKEGITAFISLAKELNVSEDALIHQLMDKFNCSKEQAVKHIEEWIQKQK